MVSPASLKRIVLAVMIASIALFATTFMNEVFILISSIALGLVYGYARIEIRASLARNYSATEASSIVATANAFSSILVVLAVLVTYLEYSLKVLTENNSILSVSFPLVFLISATLLIIAANIDVKPLEVKNNHEC